MDTTTHEETQADAPASAPQLGGPKTMLIAEVAEALGISQDAARSRVDRGTLPHVKRKDGRRAVPVYAVRAAAAAMGRNAAATHTDAGASVPQFSDAIELVERLTLRCIDAERRAAQIEAQKLISERSEVSAIDALHEARARVSALEEQVAELTAAKPRRWWHRERD
jgi:hypothetical protein